LVDWLCLVVFARVQLTEIAWEPGLAVQMAPCEMHLALWRRSESCHTASPSLQPRMQVTKDISMVRRVLFASESCLIRLSATSLSSWTQTVVIEHAKLYLASAEPSAVGDCDL
jgi:hypothetical protein